MTCAECTISVLVTITISWVMYDKLVVKAWDMSCFSSNTHTAVGKRSIGCKEADFTEI